MSMTSCRADALVALADNAVADIAHVDALRQALSFWPVFRQNIWRQLVKRASFIAADPDRDPAHLKAVALCFEAVLALSSPSDQFLASIADLPHDAIIEVVSFLTPAARSALARALTSSFPELGNEIAFRFETSVSPALPDTVISCPFIELPHTPNWIADLLGQPNSVIRTALVDLQQRCCDEVLWMVGLDQLLLHSDSSLLNLLYIWNIPGIRQIVVDRNLLRSPSQQLLSSIGLAEDESVGKGGRLFSRARRKCSDFIVQPERFAVEVEAFLKLQDPPVNQLELAGAVLRSLIQYPKPQLRKQIIGALLPYIPSKCSIEALTAACRELSVDNSAHSLSAIAVLSDLIKHRSVPL